MEAAELALCLLESANASSATGQISQPPNVLMLRPKNSHKHGNGEEKEDEDDDVEKITTKQC